MTTQLKLKKSSVIGKVPQASDLDYGELAINYADGIIYYKNSSNQVKSFIDSDLIVSSITGTVDSAYVLNLIGNVGIDSAAVIGIVDSDYVYARQQIDSAFVRSEVNTYVDSAYIGDLLGTIHKLDEITTNDSTTYQLTLSSASYSPPNATSILVSVNGIIQEAGDAYTVNSDTITFAQSLSADSDTVDFILAIGKAYSTTEHIQGVVASIVDSDYLAAIIGQPKLLDEITTADSTTYSLAYSSTPYIPLSGAALLVSVNGIIQEAGVAYTVDSDKITFAQSLSADSDTVDFILSLAFPYTVPNILDGSVTPAKFSSAITVYDSSHVTSIVDSAYVQARQVDLQRDSAFITNIIDSDYINNRVTGVDSAAVTGIVDSAYVQARQITYSTANFTDSAFVTSQINNLIDGAPGTLDTLNEIAAALNDDDSAYATLVNLIGQKVDSAAVTGIVDSAYVQARQITYSTANFTDSAYVTTQINNLIDGAPGTLNTLNEIAAALNDDDSAYATLIGLIGQKVDSAAVIGIVDSDYINNRVTGVDSAAVTGIVDSAYVALRQAAPTATQVRQYLVAGTNITYDSATGVIASTASGGGGLDSAGVVDIITTTAIDEELFVANGTQTDFTLARSPTNTETILVSLDGVVQPSTAYSLDSTVLTISPALDSNVNVKVLHLASLASIADGSIGIAKLDASLTSITEDTFVTTSGQTEYSLSKTPPSTSSLLISVDGIVQPTSAYSLDSSVLTITPALDSGTDIRVVHLGVVGSSQSIFTNHLIPSADSTYDLGDSTRKWRDLYLSGSTIHLGNIKLQDQNGSLVVLDSNLAITSLHDSARVQAQIDSDLAGFTSYDSARVQGQFDSAFPSAFDTRFALQDTHDSAAFQSQFDSALPVALASDVSLGNITTTGYLRGPSTFVIDPATHGDDTGTLRVAGNLTVDGTTTTINSTTVTTADKNIVIAQGAVDSAAADGAGITVDTAGASITYDHTNAEWDFNRDVNITGNLTTSSSTALYAETSYGSVQIRDTSTTGQELHVRNNSGKNGFLTFTEDTIADRWLIGVEAGDASLLFKTGNTGSNTERMRIDGNGNVGIGNTSPTAAKLVIEDDGGDTNSTYNGGVPFIQLYSNVAQFSAPKIEAKETSQDVGAEIAFKNVGNGAMNIIFGNRATGSATSTMTERVRINTDGKVGINNSTYTAMLDVNNTSASHQVATFRQNNASYNTDISLYHGSTPTDNTLITKRANGNLWLYQGTSKTIEFHTNAAQRMYIEAGGHVSVVSGSLDSGTDSNGVANVGFGVRSGAGGSDYGRIRFYHGGSNLQTIHAFPAAWQGGSLSGASAGAINIQGQNGITFGPWNALDGYIDASGNMTMAGSITANSDIRVKTNIETIEDALDKVLKLRGVRFNKTEKGDPNKKYIGVIAQEVEEVIPEVVSKSDDERGTLSVDYGNIVGLLIEAMKEQQEKIDALEKRLDGNNN